MKTIREWLNELPEDVRSKAVENVNAMMSGVTMEKLTPTVKRAISSAFPWMPSNEGFDYWFKIYTSL
jgi:hypothetical protein